MSSGSGPPLLPTFLFLDINQKSFVYLIESKRLIKVNGEIMQRIEDGEKYQLILTPELIQRLDRVGKRLGLKRAQVMRNTMDVGLSIYEDFEKVGVVSVLEILSRVKKALTSEVGQMTLFKTHKQ